MTEILDGHTIKEAANAIGDILSDLPRGVYVPVVLGAVIWVIACGYDKQDDIDALMDELKVTVLEAKDMMKLEPKETLQ